MCFSSPTGTEPLEQPQKQGITFKSQQNYYCSFAWTLTAPHVFGDVLDASITEKLADFFVFYFVLFSKDCFLVLEYELRQSNYSKAY